jgi:peptidyl-prolyl cis-trans isomerase SurA
VQHILLKPNVGKSDIAAAKIKLDTIRQNIAAGKITFAEAVNKYSDEPMSKFTGGMLQNNMGGGTLLTIDQLDQPSERDIVLMLDTLKPGGISAPQQYTDDENGATNLRIVYLKTRTNPHRENLNDDYARIQQRTLAIKQAEARDKWLRETIPTYYIHVDNEFKKCGHIARWMGAVAQK